MASARAAAATNNIQTSYMNFNQVAATGIASPPAITTPLQTLGAAGLPNVKNDPTRLAAAVAQCKTYTGIDGLRRLQVDQANLSAVAPGCGDYDVDGATSLAQASIPSSTKRHSVIPTVHST